MEDLKDRCLEGYQYEIRTGNGPVKPPERRVVMYPNAAGAKMYIDECRKIGLPDELIATSIFCYTDMGRLPLSILKVTKRNETIS